jgi:tetratricopeptide (TPR) repeat protein
MLKNRAAIFFVILNLFAFNAYCERAADYFNAGTAAYLAGNYSNALKYLNAAIKLDVRNPKYYSAVGDCYKQMGNIEKALVYYDYADKLGGVPQEDYYEKKEKESLSYSNLIATNPVTLSLGLMDIYYERRIFDSLSLGIDLGYAWTTSIIDLSFGNAGFSGIGYSLGGRVNWFFQKKALTGFFLGPELYYYGYSMTLNSNDGSGVTDVSKATIFIITAGLHLGYRMIFDGGFSLDGIFSVNYLSNFSDGSVQFAKIALILPAVGANAGYAS